MAPEPHGGRRTLHGLWTPPVPGESDAGNRFVRSFLTYTEMGGEPIDEPWIVAKLANLSAYDCLDFLGRLSCMLEAAPTANVEQQVRIMRRLGWSEATVAVAQTAITASGNPRAMFFPQQVAHLARLAVLHADPRRADGFGGGAQAQEIVTCLLAVTELLGEGDADLESEDGQISWILRQVAINERPDSVAMWTRYYDIFVRIWGEVATAEQFEAGAAFKRYTGLTIERWLAVAFGIYAQFLGYGRFTTDDFGIDATRYFANTNVSEAEAQTMIEQSARTLHELRKEIRAEEEKFGPTVYRCQAFEQHPLLRIPDRESTVIPIAVDAYQRHVLQGIFWILSDGAINEGFAREHFTSAFGSVFEEWVQRTYERALPAVGTPRVYRARQYKRGKNAVDSTDVVLDYSPDSAVFVEVVAKRPQSATVTRGDIGAFTFDLEAGVMKKAKQLDHNIKDFRDGRLVLGEMKPAQISRIYPVIVAVEGFPDLPPIPQRIERELAARDLLRDLPPLALLSGEELVAVEALMEHGFSFAVLLQRWKLNPNTAALPFANFYDLTDDLHAPEIQRAAHQDQVWAELVGFFHGNLFAPAQQDAEGS